MLTLSLLRIGAAAGSCTRMLAVRQDLRGGETFWLLNHSRKESKRAGSNHAPGPCHFNKEQTPLAILRYQPTVSRWFFRCLGAHLLRSPLNVKALQIVSARDFASDGQSPPVESLGFPAPEFVCCCPTSSRRHFLSAHSALPFVIEFASCFGSAWVNKKPCFHSGKQGLEIL